MARSMIAVQIVLSGALLGACATVTQGTSQQIAVTTPGVPTASCRLTDGHSLNKTLSTPGSVKIAKRHAPITVACNAADGQTATRTFKPRYANAAKVQMPGGYALDALTGAMWSYPAEFVVPFGPADQPSAPPPTRASGR